MVKLLFVGLDGATWTVLGPLMDAGLLPNLGALRDRGAHGKLRTCRPPYTFPAWKVISSGRPPASLGVFGWIGVDFAAHRFTYPDARAFNTPEVWDYLAEEGSRVATVNMPATWPVRPIANEGVMVGDPFARSSVTFSPPDAEARYGLGPYTTDTPLAFRDSPEAALALLRKLEGERFEISKALAPRVDVLFHTVFFCDPVQHFHWDDARTLEAAWTWIDAEIGKLLAAATPEHVVVCSDHGFTRIAHQFNVNRWLQAKGLLVLKGSRAAPFLYRLGVTRERVLGVAKTLGIPEKTLVKVVPLKVRRGVPNEDGELGVNRLALVDWHQSRAMTADGFQIFVRDDEARRTILQELPRLTVPGTKRDALESVTDAQALSGIPGAPVVVTPNDGLLLAHKFGGPLWRKDEFSGGWQATHALDGVLVLAGPGIPRGPIEGARLVDVAPTLLALAGARVPTSMAGRPLAGSSGGPRDPLPPPFGERSRAGSVPTLDEKVRRLRGGK